MTEDEEDYEDYVKGGYHPVHLGDAFADTRYTVVRKLGWGHFSTVWLAEDRRSQRHVALKVVKSATRYTETALDEIKLLQRTISSASIPDTSAAGPIGRAHVIALLDHFRHRGPHGSHVCMVFEVLGENLLGLIRRHQHRGVPIHLVRQIAKQVLLGLDYLHTKCGMIHTDLKPENVLVAIEMLKPPERTGKEYGAKGQAQKIVGVSAGRGRGGNVTPRPENVFITGSQPLPSPSISASSSVSGGAGGSYMDKWGFGMSKIDDNNAASAPGSVPKNDTPATSASNSRAADEAARMLGDVRLASTSARASPAPGAGAPLAPDGGEAIAKKTGLLAQSLAEHAGLAPDAGAQPGTSASSSNMDVRSDGAAPPAEDISWEEMPERIQVKIADLGNATWIEHHFTDDIQTRQYRCPEVILGAKWGPTADIWSAACLFFELLTGGDYLFDPASGARYTKDDDHLAQIIELVGDFPKSLALAGRFSSQFFNRRGELRHITKLRFWPLEDVLADKYMLPREQAQLIASVLSPMMRLHPDKRASAREMLGHRWLVNVPIGPVSIGGTLDAMKPVEMPGADEMVEDETRRS
ncbi:kinase-like protein [Auriculariales sp. MPI-PUGE-AT-0066]|nr:kinase-like protein [Auriculariales sp. MPI-PUGE-AT-0066]